MNVSVAEICSQLQLSKQRGGVKVLKNRTRLKNSNESISKLKQEMRESTYSFYQGIRSKQGKLKQREETSATMEVGEREDCEIEELHY
jgi:hypothetical protein